MKNTMEKAAFNFAMNVEARYKRGRKPDIIRRLNKEANLAGVRGRLLGFSGAYPQYYIDTFAQTSNISEMILVEKEPVLFDIATQELKQKKNSLVNVSLFNKDIFKLRLKETGGKVDLIDLDFCIKPSHELSIEAWKLCNRFMQTDRPVELRMTMTMRGPGSTREICTRIHKATVSLLTCQGYELIRERSLTFSSSTNKTKKGGSPVFVSSTILIKHKLR